MNEFVLKKRYWRQVVLSIMIGASLYGCASTLATQPINAEKIAAEKPESIDSSEPLEIKLSLKNVYRIIGHAPTVIPSTCNELDAEIKNFNIYRHVLPIQGRGKPNQINLAIEVNGQECPVIPSNKPNNQQSWVDEIIKGITEFADKTGQAGKTPVVYTFIHGGLNGYDASENRIARDLGPMMAGEYDGGELNEKLKYYPIFLVWISDLWATYGDSIANYDQGQWDKPWWIRVAAPFRLLGRDIPDVVMHSFLNYSKTTMRWLQRERYDDYSCNTLKAPLNLNDQFKCVDPQKSQTEIDGEDFLYWGTSPFRAISVPLVDTVGKVAWKNMVARARFGMRRPCVDVYQADGDSCGRGVYYKLFQALQGAIAQTKNDKAALHKLKITLAGHSMGTFVASELVSSFPELPYNDVVFMGAAVSIREFLDSVQRVMIHRQSHDQEINSAIAPVRNKAFFEALDSICPDKTEAKKIADSASAISGKRSGFKKQQLQSMQNLPTQAKACETTIKKSEEQLRRALEAVDHIQPKKPFDFYNLSLDENAEAKEYDIGASFGLSPRGSLLEWIDDLYETPSDFLERTIGKWKNVVAAREFFTANGSASTVEHLHFKKFDLDCDSPKRHGELASTKRECAAPAYWDPKYWR
jgi:hypothetical protein